MGNIFKGASFTNSKIASRKILSDAEGNLDIDEPGNYTNSVSLKSNTKAAINPTSDSDDNSRAPQGNGDESMTPSSKGGASGDGPTPGFTGSGTGVAELNGAQSNDATRKLNY